MGSTKRIRKAVIPAAGLGTRFLPATKSIPKEMIPVVDVPMIQLIIEEAVAAGIEDIILVTARHKDSIENHFDYNYELEDTLQKRGKTELAQVSSKIAEMCNLISIRQKNPRGLGHAVWCAKPIVGDEPFAVLLGDDLIDSTVPVTKQISQIYDEKGCSTVGVMEVAQDQTSKYGIVGGDMENDRLMKVSHLVEKPEPAKAPSRLAIPGRYVLDSAIFDILEKTQPGKGGEIQLTDGLQSLADSKGLYAYCFEGTRYDTGDKLGFIDATLAYALKRPELAPDVKKVMQKHLGVSS